TGAGITLTSGSGGVSIGSAANSSAGNIVLQAGSAGTGGGGAAGTAGNINFQVATGATINVGANGIANTIQIGNTTGAVAQTINIGNNGTASSTNNVNIGSSIAGTTAITGPTTITGRTSGSLDALTISNSTSTGAIAIFKDNTTAVLTIADGGGILLQNQTNSASAIQIKDSSTEVLFSADTTARGAGGGNLIKIGNSTGTDTATTILQLDGATAVPTTNLSALNGGMFYNSTTNKVSIIENGAVKVVCNTTDAGCGAGGATTLQTAYDATSGNTITTTNARDLTFTFADTATDSNFIVNLQCVTSCSTNGVFAIQKAGTNVFRVSPNGNIDLGIGGIASTIQIGNTTGAVTQTINFGTNSTASSVTNITIGSIIGASATTIQAGSTGISLAANTAITGTLTTSGFVGINGAGISTNDVINMSNTFTNTSGNQSGIKDILTVNPGGASSAITYGTYLQLTTPGANANNITGGLVAGHTRIDHVGSGTLSSAYGQYSFISSTSGAITTAYGSIGQVDNASTNTFTTVVGSIGITKVLSSGGITTAAGITGNVDNSGTGTIATANGVSSLINVSAGGTITSGRGLYINTPTGAGTLTAAYGIYVDIQNKGTSAYGARIDTATTQALWLSGNADSTTAAQGIAFGQTVETQANLYRSGANALKSDSSFTAAGLVSTAANTVQFNDSDNSNFVAFKSASVVASNVTWTLPSADAAGCFQSNGSGTVSIAACGDTNIQTFSSNANYTLPTGALMVIVESWGGGGGGGGGTGGTTAAV
ncbi:hypothetical protein H0W80_05195, partial [Candidatus Saccharibacteria bacterium]|nr:hypothetical protein [Candidatus Saccharibacteria bacterium]